MELDELLEELSGELREPVSIDDRRLRLLAYSTHEQSVDPVRERSIMARSVSAEVAQWLLAQGIELAEEPLHIVANRELGLEARVCVPLRRNSMLLGFLWVVVGDRTLDSDQLAALERYTPQAAELIWQRRFESDLRRAKATSALAELLAGESSRVRAIAARGLRDTLGWGERERFSVVLCDCPDGEANSIGERLRRRRRSPTIGSAAAAGHDRLVVLGSLLVAETPQELAEAAIDAGARRACASRAFTDLTTAADQLELAEDGLLAASALGGGQRAATVESLGSWPTVARLWSASGRPVRPPELEPLLAAHDGAELAATLLEVLDAEVELASLARSMNLHRATLYRRIARAESLTGLRIAHGDERLRLHLALKLWKLAATHPLD